MKRSNGYRLEASRYQKIFAQNRRVEGRMLVIWSYCGADAGQKAGVIVSKRVFQRAVDRNRAKRLMRSAFQQKRGLLRTNADLIITARRGIAGQQCAAVAAELETLLRRARLVTTAAFVQTQPE